MDEIKRVIIPMDYEYMGEFFPCPNCKEEGFVYANLSVSEERIIYGDYKCVKCEYEWSKV